MGNGTSGAAPSPAAGSDGAARGRLQGGRPSDEHADGGSRRSSEARQAQRRPHLPKDKFASTAPPAGGSAAAAGAATPQPPGRDTPGASRLALTGDRRAVAPRRPPLTRSATTVDGAAAARVATAGVVGGRGRR